MKIQTNAIIIAPPTSGKTTFVKKLNDGLDINERIAGDLDYPARHDVDQEIKSLHSRLLNAYFKMGMKVFVVSRQIDINSLNPENLTIYYVEFTDERKAELPEIAKARGDSDEAVERMTGSFDKYPTYDELQHEFGKRVTIEHVVLDKGQFLSDYFDDQSGTTDDHEPIHTDEFNAGGETANVEGDGSSSTENAETSTTEETEDGDEKQDTSKVKDQIDV